MKPQAEPLADRSRDALIQHIENNRAAFLASMSMTKTNVAKPDQAVIPPSAALTGAEPSASRRAVRFATLLSWGLLEPKLSRRMQAKPISTLGLACLAGFACVAVYLNPKD